jgi:LacI family transcriptional regulator
MSMVTIRDVAKLAGVAPITVSRVINDSEEVNPATRQRVKKAVEELNYVPNILAKSLRSKRSHTIALVVSDVTNPFYTTIARGVEDTAAQSGFHVILCNTDENPDKEANYINILLQRRVDGIIISPTTDNRKQLASLKRQQVPCVLIDRQVPGCKSDVVRCDSREGARRLIWHLLHLDHRRIAMISGPRGISTADDRVEGYCQALRERGLPVEERLIKRGGYKQTSGYQLTQELLKDQPRPTAIFAANNFIAVGALQALREAGLNVPEDMALVCFDDIPQASLIYPFLTVVAQPAYEMGKVAAELLLERLAGKRNRKVREVMLETELIVRKSCGQELAPARTLDTLQTGERR